MAEEREDRTPLRLYAGPKQEKEYLRKQRQLSLKEGQIVGSSDKQETTALVVLETPKVKNQPIADATVIPRLSMPISPYRETISDILHRWIIITFSYALGIGGVSINASVAYRNGTDYDQKIIMTAIFVLLEGLAFFLPDLAKTLWKKRQYVRFIIAWLLWLPLFGFALNNGLGFASTFKTEGNTVRAERITPAVADAQRKLETLSASRADECKKRGDKCRQLETEEKQALQALTDAREKVAETSDPQTTLGAKLVSRLTTFHPTAEDFAIVWLLFLTVLPQIGGLIRMVASK